MSHEGYFLQSDLTDEVLDVCRHEREGHVDGVGALAVVPTVHRKHRPLGDEVDLLANLLPVLLAPEKPVLDHQGSLSQTVFALVGDVGQVHGLAGPLQSLDVAATIPGWVNNAIFHIVRFFPCLNSVVVILGWTDLAHILFQVHMSNGL